MRRAPGHDVTVSIDFDIKVGSALKKALESLVFSFDFSFPPKNIGIQT